MKPIISVENLGKSYRIRREAVDAPTTFREVLTELPRKLFKGGPKTKTEEFRALDDVSFDIMPGERVGIIGRNGAGKSTLLKLLSRITEPTRGKITMRGRAASLLEVGTGFHPELTGRENIFLNGAILGMSRAEVSKKFDEIVDFAGVEKFLDTPVKRYSSGMYVRLGFAVAAHLEPEILIVDEVLAVGDMEFQKKCLSKMEEVSKGQGRAVLFVSHNMGAVQRVCDKGLFLAQGALNKDGFVAEVIDSYRNSIQMDLQCQEVVSEKILEVDAISLRSFKISNESKTRSSLLISGRRVFFELHCRIKVPLYHTRIFFHVENDSGARLCSMGNYWFEISRTMEKGDWVILCDIDKLPFSKGSYKVFVDIHSDTATLLRIYMGSFYIEESDFFSSHAAGNPQLGVLIEHSISITPHL